MPFQLKDYQQRCLDELARYLRSACELQRADTAFYEATGRPYHDVPDVAGIPYVCVRVPTGGGKTVMAAHAVSVATREFLRFERTLVLWLAPTTQIVSQTLSALRARGHPYRQALDAAFDGRVSIFDLKSALYISRSAVDSDTCIIVTTLAALRVEDTDGRKVYEANGHLQEHFSRTAEIPSLANLLKSRRPIVIVDEAHNARTRLSFDTLARFSPSCILEFTATPAQERADNPSNVLTHVAAAELKAEEMIKLPIWLTSLPQWTEAVQLAIAKRDELQLLADAERARSGEYIRPIVLLQAQRHSRDASAITFDVLCESLKNDFKIPSDQIAVATGTLDELGAQDVLSETCPIRYIITVEKLREGWDCPFAYILCGVASLSSKTAVEQILGRVMRLPHAKRKAADDLNHAFAFVTSQKFVDAANSLRDALVDCGFERYEANEIVQSSQPGFADDFGFLSPTFSEIFFAKPDLTSLSEPLRAKIRIDDRGAAVRLTYSGPAITQAEKAEFGTVFPEPRDKEAVERLYRKSHGLLASPASMRKPFSVPMLAVRVDGVLELFEDQFRDVTWDPSIDDALLSEQEFPSAAPGAEVGSLDFDADSKLLMRSPIQILQEDLLKLEMRGPRTMAELIDWLDRSIPHPDITQQESTLFLLRVVESLTERRAMTLDRLTANRFRLKEAVQKKMDEYRARLASQSFQHILFTESNARVEVSPAICFAFPYDQYPAPNRYEGPLRFDKHYYDGAPASMNDEEATCASVIDGLSVVEYWVRNLEREGYSFWLPTPTDKFYPDFVAKLVDSQYLVVEYKGGMLLDSGDTRQKNTIGELWQSRSNGSCLFRLVSRNDMRYVLQNLPSGPALSG